MQISDAGLRFIASFEGLVNHLYDDEGPGVGNCTIGVGHLVHLGPCDNRLEEAPYLNGLTDGECYALLREDAELAVRSVNAAVRVPLTTNQADALIDLTFNAGIVQSVFAAVNNGGDVCAALRQIVHDGNGNVLPGLVRRRDADCELYYRPEEEHMASTEYDNLHETDDAIKAQLLSTAIDLGKQYAALSAAVGALAVANAGSFKGIESRLTALEAK